ncbi:hypothetical protein [Halosimplex salinum]|uniref:hypothetical protein n=1 Tax=Halosimplex salinum TaxID=1710538 RepID=UPI000F49A707|nr:hypothetical protein [Halosimplex salinum]
MSDGEGSGDDARTRSAKWRCAWCDKPHDRNDPPCDNCGHHKFEKAVVPVAPDDPDHQREPVWVCPECGRVHQKNSPPCSRCGNASLERRVPDDADYAEELSGTSYVDLLSARYAAGLAVALVAGAVLVLGLLGVVTLPGMGSDVPGSAESVAGVDLAETETAFVADLNERRSVAGFEAYERHESLDDATRLYNEGRLRAVYDGGTRYGEQSVLDELDGACGEEITALRAYSLTAEDAGDGVFDSPEALATALVDDYERFDQTFYETPRGRVGVDVHAGPDDRVFVSVLVC